MVYNNNKNSLVNVPRHDIDPNLKSGKKWGINVAEYIYSYHFNSWLNKRQQEFTDLRKYARGEQDSRKYKSVFLGQANTIPERPTEIETTSNSEFYDLSNHRIGFANIDFDSIFSPAPNMLMTLVGMMSGQRHKIRVFAKDSNASDMRNDIKYKMQARILFKDLYDSFSALIGGGEEEVMPSTMEELQMYSIMGGLSLPYEIGMQEVVTYTLENENRIKYIQDKNIYDLAVIGMAATVDEVDEFSQVVLPRYVDPENLILQYSEQSVKQDGIEFWGEQRYMTILQLRKKGIPELELREIAYVYRNNSSLGNPDISLDKVEVYTQMGYCNYDNFRIPILYYEYLTVNSDYYTNVKSQENGEFTIKEPYKSNGYKLPKIHNNENRKTTSHDYPCWYKGYWVIGTNQLFDYGKKYDQPYDKATKRPRCSLHFTCLPYPSIIKQIKPILDDCQMLYLRYQNDKATAPPANGLAIDIGSLNSLKIGNKKLHPFDTIKIYTQSGKLLYSMHEVDIPGAQSKFNNVLPFQQLDGGIGRAVQDFIVGINNAYQQIASLSGMDRLTLNSYTPTSEQSATQIKYAVSGTKDTLKSLYNNFISVKESLALNVAIRASYLICNNNDKNKGYYGIISEAKILAIQTAGKKNPIEFGIDAIAMPDEKEIEAILSAAQAATAGGKNGIPALSFSEYLFIFDALTMGVSLKYIIAYINYKENLRDKMAAQLSQQAQAMDTEKGIAVNKAKYEAEKELEKVKSDEAIRQYYNKGFIDIIVNNAKQTDKAESDLKRLALEMGFDVGKAQFDMQGQMPEGEGEMPMQEQGGEMPMQEGNQPPTQEQMSA